MKRLLPLFLILFSLQLLPGENIVNGISLEEKKDLLIISLKGQVPKDYKITEMGAPFRIVVDFPSSIYKESTLAEKPSFYPVKEIRLSQFQENPPVVRLVVETVEKAEYQVDGTKGFRLLIKRREKPLTPSKHGTQPPLLPLPSTNISVSKSENPPHSSQDLRIVYNSSPNTSHNDDPSVLVSLDFLKADIRDVFKSLTLQTGINFFLSSEVKGEVTLTAEKISVEDAVTLICKLNNLVFKKEKEGYIIATPQEMERLYPTPTTTITLLLKNAKPADVLPVLEKAFPKGSFQTVGNAIVATLPEEDVEAVRKLVADLDNTQAPSPKEEEVTNIVTLSYLDVDDAIEMLKTLFPQVKAAKAPSQSFLAFAAMAGGYGMGGYGMGGYGMGGYGGVSGFGGIGGTTGAGALGVGVGMGMGMGFSPAMFQQKPDKLVLIGPGSAVEKAEKALKKLDIPPKQIHIQARVTDISEDAAKQLGIQWGFPIGETLTETGGGGLKIGRIERSPLQISATIDAILSQGKGIQLANPSLALVDGRGANILVGERIMYTRRTGITPLGMPIYEIAEEQVGVILRLNAKVAEDNTITLYVRPEVSYLIGMTGPENLPQIATRQAETVLRLKSGETIALGGLLQEKDIEQMRKVPLLGELPFFGNLFRWRSKTKTHSEILIFITASVLG